MTTTTVTRTPSAEAVLAALGRLRLVTITAAYLEAEVTTTSPGSTYRVRVGPGPKWACSCPSAVYGGRGASACKHAEALRLLIRALPSPLLGDWL